MFGDCTRYAKIKDSTTKEGRMNNDGEFGGLEILRDWTMELVKSCQDMDLLDLVYKLLLQG